jgi:hypothetical protein
LFYFSRFAAPVRVGWIAPVTISCLSLTCQSLDVGSFRSTKTFQVVIFLQRIRESEVDFTGKCTEFIAPRQLL